MFSIDFCGRTENFNFINTSNISNQFPNKNKNKQKLVLYYNSIGISLPKSIPLVELGCSPSDKLELQYVDLKRLYFILPSLKLNFSFKKDITYTVFDAKLHFSIFFKTVPQNIIIKYYNDILSDETHLHIYNSSENKPFEILIAEGYDLYYTYFNPNFHFICMKKGSTLKNLKDTIIIYNHLFYGVVYGKRIKEFFKDSDQLVIENTNLEKLTEKNIIFDFDFHENEKITPIEIQISIKTDHSPINTNYIVYSETTVYFITCYLEEQFGIDRSLFIPYNANHQPLQPDSPIRPNINTNLIFCLHKKLNVKINGKNTELSYLTTIEDIHKKFNYNEHNFGIVTNNHFVTESSLNFSSLLIRFLNNSEDPRKATEIKINYSKTPCKQKGICILSGQKERKNRLFIVPNNCEYEEILKSYMHENTGSLESIKIDENGFAYYERAENHSLVYDFEDETGKREVKTIELKGKKPRIIDLFKQIHHEFHGKKHWYSKANTKEYIFEAEFDDKKLNFWQHLSRIQYSEKKRIKVKASIFQKKKGREEKKFKVNLNTSNVQTFLPYNFISAQEIIKELSKSHAFENLENISLFLNYNKLEPNDIPTICKQDKDFLILSEISNEKTFVISNGTTLRIRTTISKQNFKNAAEVISGMFGTTNDQATFLQRTPNNQKGSPLPVDFNAACLPDDAEIKINYEYKNEGNRYTFLHDGKPIKITISGDHPINSLKEEIQEKLRKYDASKNSLSFQINKYELDENKRFSQYEILENALITVSTSKSFCVHVKFPEGITKTYKMSSKDTIKDVQVLIQKQMNYDRKICLLNNEKQRINEEEKVTENMKVFIECNQVKIRCQGLNGSSIEEEQEVLVSELLTALQAYAFLKVKFNESSIAIFTYDEDKKCYKNVEKTKVLFEVGADLFANKPLNIRELNFDGSPVILNSATISSTYNTLQWFKKFVVSKAISAPPENFGIAFNGKQFDEYQTMAEILKESDGKLEIKFAFDWKKPTSEPYKPVSKRKFKPKIINLDAPIETKITAASMRVKKPKLDAPKRGVSAKNENEKIKESEEARIDEEDEPNCNEKDEKIDKESKNDNNNLDNDHTKVDENNNNKEDTNNNDNNKGSDVDNDHTKVDENNDKDVNNDDDKKVAGCAGDSDGSENEAEMRKIIEAEEGKCFVYSFKAENEEPFSLSFGENATIEDAKVEVARHLGDVEASCVSIIFAGKVLKKETQIRRLNLDGEDVLQVFIRNTDDIFLKTARALRVLSQADLDEYYSEYEYED